MIVNYRSIFRRIPHIFFATVYMVLMSVPAGAAEYENALKGVKNYDAVYEVSQGDPKVVNPVFLVIKNSYEAPEVKALSKDPNIAIVFHGPVVKLLSTDSASFNEAELVEVQKFQATLKQMKKDGVTLEVCRYALKGMGVDEATIIPEIDPVDNGFVSVIGYQMQGYAVVRIP
ncbi:DsrE family protein [uncultured Marinobacter sp.]|uniref:DsrE family protein n=1 Tax=uncultured Marinobacter sp. TaxID=187379 RepID=UPI0030DBEBC8|tara:strand:- start:502 stop:1020 length:519 start_codon:yes stop_codon:yes gene_type:complete